MLHILFNSEPWFAPKRFGYGAGLPVAWQGWAVYGAFAALAIGLARLAQQRPDLWLPVAIPLLAAAIALLVVITRRHTRGGWRWRWGGED